MAHPNKEISAAIEYAEKHGWRIEKCNGHAWGRMLCPTNKEDCRCGVFCIKSIWSTPTNTESHARQIRKVVDNCKYNKNEAEDAD